MTPRTRQCMDWFWTIYDLSLITLPLLEDLLSFSGKQSDSEQAAQHIDSSEQLLTRPCSLFRLLKMLPNFQVFFRNSTSNVFAEGKYHGKNHKDWHVKWTQWRSEYPISFFVLNKHRKV